MVHLDRSLQIHAADSYSQVYYSLISYIQRTYGHSTNRFIEHLPCICRHCYDFKHLTFQSVWPWMWGEASIGRTTVEELEAILMRIFKYQPPKNAVYELRTRTYYGRFWLGTGRMPQVKGPALHVRMRNRGDNTWFIMAVHACAGAHALTQLQTALQYHTMGYGLIPRPSTC